MTSIQHQEAEETRQMYQDYIIDNYEKPSAEFSEGINERFIEACEVENRYSFGDDTDTPSLLTAESEENDGWTKEEEEDIMKMLSENKSDSDSDETVIFESESFWCEHCEVLKTAEEFEDGVDGFCQECSEDDFVRDARIKAEELEETKERNKQHEILMGKSLRACAECLGGLLKMYEFPKQSIERLSDLAEEYLYAHDMDTLDALSIISKPICIGLTLMERVDEDLMCFVQSCLMADDEDEECEELALCKNCDPTYTGKKDPCCITMGRNCGKGLPHITETEVFAGLEEDDALGLSYKEDPKPIHTKITATPTLAVDKSEKSYGTKKPEIVESRRALKNKIRVFEDKMIEKRETQTKDNWMGMKPLKKELAEILDAIMEEECKAGDGWVLRWKDAIEGRYDELFGKAKKQTTKKTEGVFGAKTDEIFKYMGEWEDKMEEIPSVHPLRDADIIKKTVKEYSKYINDKRRKYISQESKDKFEKFGAKLVCFAVGHPQPIAFD